MTRTISMLVALMILAVPAMAQDMDTQTQPEAAPQQAVAPAQAEPVAPQAEPLPADPAEGQPEAVLQAPADAERQSPDKLAFGMPANHGIKWLKFNATLQNIFLYSNDSDFDGTPPYYDANGQTVGLLGTFLKPRLELLPIEQVSIVWEMELGLNLWSRHNPDQYQSGEMDTFRLAQRELYVKGEFMEGLIGFKVGYQYLHDATHLFIGHWAGAAQFSSRREWAEFTFTVAQLPDQTFEGVTLEANNFQHDTFVYGLQVDIPIKQWEVGIGLWGLHDSEIVGQTLNLFSPGVRIGANYGFVDFGIDAIFQAGTTQRGASQVDEQTIAWALQGWAEFEVADFGIDFHQLILSGDDKYDRNADNGAFIYSGKSRSRTIMLTEDEIRDIGANLDERLAEKRNSFYLVRPGLAVTDLAFSYTMNEVFIPTVIVGTGFVLNSDNALGGEMVGVEMDLDLEFVYREIISFHIIGGVLIPGKAGAAYLNSYDRRATRTQYMIESSLSVFF